MRPPKYEVWAADVAFVSRERWEQGDPDGYLAGAPELVAEVLSPSNTAEASR
jgi:Uma2 family endonuclease